MAIRDDFAPGEVLTSADLNDTFASKLPYSYGTAEPTTSTNGFVWFDENFSPPVAKVWNGSAFVAFSQGPADFSDSATGTYTDTGVDYKYITYTASGTLTVTRAGFADVLVVGGGGGTDIGQTYSAGGGAGGMLELSSAYLPSGTLTVTVGAGGIRTSDGSGNHGSDSALDTFVAAGGGGGGDTNSAIFILHGDSGGSGSGASGGAGRTPGLGITNQGNDGGAVASGFGGGGGAGGAGSGGTAGAGKASSITGSSVTYAKGGASSGSNVANTGDGGQGASAGNSGVVIVRVRTS